MREGTWAVGLLAALVCGCAPAMPSLAGGSTVPEARGDLIAGGSARIPVRASSVPATDGGSGSAFGASAGGAGLVPVAAARWGVDEHWDLGLTVAGTEGRLAVRRELVQKEAITRPAFVVGAGLTGGWIEDGGAGGGSGWRLGGEVPLLYAVELGGVYEVWLGARLGAEHVRGDFALGGETAEAAATAVRAGPVLGLGAGFRRFHVLLELTACYEGWFGDHRSLAVDGGGWVLVPAFAVRLRL